jgi:hypothetical protein
VFGGAAGRIENAQVTVHLAYVTSDAHTLVAADTDPPSLSATGGEAGVTVEGTKSPDSTVAAPAGRLNPRNPPVVVA